MKCAIYSRYSTSGQDEHSISQQVDICEAYAAEHGMEVDQRFADEAISGAAFGNRPAFLRMRTAAMAREFDVLLVADTTRLARSQELAPLIDRLRHQRIRVIGVMDQFDSASGHSDMQAGMSGILSTEFRKMVRTRTHHALTMRARDKKATGGRCYGYTPAGEIDEVQAKHVRGVFERFALGASAGAIAAELNAAGIPSPGSSWKRTQRRCRGWLGSAVRAILLNPRYRGEVVWNQSTWRRDPDSGKRTRVLRPRSEWIVRQDESQRIVSDAVWQAAQRTTRLGDDRRLKAGGVARHLLSGLVECASCGAHFVMAGKHSYVCSSYAFGRCCDNGVRVRRDHLEHIVLSPVFDDLLEPSRVAAMAKRIERLYSERMRTRQARAEQAPAELKALDERIARLRERLQRGDPDMAADEIQVAIERAEGKRSELAGAQPKQTAKVVSILPGAAAAYVKQIKAGLGGKPEAAAKARLILRELLGGKVKLQPEADGSLWAVYELQPAALLKAAAGACSTGSGGRI